MSTENIVSPAAETQNPAADTETPDVVTPEEAVVEAEQEGASTDDESGGDDADKSLKRMQRRIDRRTADFHRANARAEQLAQQLESLKSQSGPTEEPQNSRQTDAVALAKEIARTERFNETADKLVADGNKKHKDFMPALKSLADEVGPFVVNGLPSPFMEAVLEVAEKPTELLYHLGKNPEVAEELASLSPMKLAKRLDRIERELTESGKPKTSSAPKPLAPVKGVATDSDLGPGLSDAEWMRRREAQIREQRGR